MSYNRNRSVVAVLSCSRLVPLWRLLDVEAKAGIRITESFAMWPGSSVIGLYFAHPESRYFSLGKIDRDQVADYSQRKRMSTAEVER